jgi:hypothetical protein
MKLKVIAIVGLLAIADMAHAAHISIVDQTIMPGDPTIIQVPILISPDGPGELISGMNILFAVGTAADAIPIVDDDPSRGSIGTPEEFDGSIWAAANSSYFGIAGTPGIHTVVSSVSRIGAPQHIPPDGIIATYTIDVTGLPSGDYALDPNYPSSISGLGTSAFVFDGQVVTPLSLTFDPGVLTIAVPEPSTVVLSGLAALLGLVSSSRSRSRRAVKN